MVQAQRVPLSESDSTVQRFPWNGLGLNRVISVPLFVSTSAKRVSASKGSPMFKDAHCLVLALKCFFARGKAHTERIE